jgi:hypothetical protein
LKCYDKIDALTLKLGRVSISICGVNRYKKYRNTAKYSIHIINIQVIYLFANLKIIVTRN